MLMKIMPLTGSASNLFNAVVLLSLSMTTPLYAPAAEFSSKDYAVGNMPIAVVVHDFNADGKLDLAVLNTGSGDVNGDGKPDLVVERTQFDSACLPAGGFSIFLGNGDSTFQPEKDIASNPLDVNGDGITDIADTHGYTGPLSIFLGQGNGQYQPLQAGPEGNAGLFTVGDFNNDQKQDQATFVLVCTGFFCPQHEVSYLGIALGNGKIGR